MVLAFAVAFVQCSATESDLLYEKDFDSDGNYSKPLSSEALYDTIPAIMCPDPQLGDLSRAPENNHAPAPWIW
ncbi:hypothetical protein FQN52_006500 [Onygenales sp. PD_12]|nr:hypothetical protein FQN52_006500 [Onygenales sp. PD_12]